MHCIRLFSRKRKWKPTMHNGIDIGQYRIWNDSKKVFKVEKRLNRNTWVVDDERGCVHCSELKLVTESSLYNRFTNKKKQ